MRSPETKDPLQLSTQQSSLATWCQSTSLPCPISLENFWGKKIHLERGKKYSDTETLSPSSQYI